MRKLCAPLLLAVVTLGLPAVPATALAVTADCGLNTFAQEFVTGGQETFTGGAYGYAVSDVPGASISVSCEVRVNGGPVASTPFGPSGQGSFTAGQVTYTAAETDTVTLCAVWTGSESGELCGPTTTQQVPPQEVIDALNQVSDLIADATAGLDPIVCSAIIAAGLPALANSQESVTSVHIDEDDCDVWVLVDLPPLFHCPTRIVDLVAYFDPYTGPNCP
jgi:hypothetical protein